MISESIIAEITPPTCEQHVDEDLGVAGDWNSDLEKVFGIFIEAAKI